MGSSPCLSADARSQLRTSMFLAAVLRAKSEQAPVKVRNMSATGAMLESVIVPKPDTEIHLVRGALAVRGTVVWSSSKRCGLRFSSEVSVKEWLASTSDKPQQQRLDDIVALVKAGGSDPAFLNNVEHEDRSNEQLADDLQAIVRLMQDLEVDLAASVETVERHAIKLQNLDIAMQMMRAISSELTRGVDSCLGNFARLKDLRVTCAHALAGS